MKRFKHIQPITRRKSGYSLIELLVVISILGTISGPVFSSYISRARYQILQSASIATAEWLENARKRAMQNNSQCVISSSISNAKLSEDSTSSCGSISDLNLSEISQGSSRVNICYRNIDPLGSGLGCNSQTVNSSLTLTFSPRGTNLVDAVYEFYQQGQSAQTCAVVIKPLGIIRHGKISNGYCDTSNG